MQSYSAKKTIVNKLITYLFHINEIYDNRAFMRHHFINNFALICRNKKANRISDEVEAKTLRNKGVQGIFVNNILLKKKINPFSIHALP